MKTWLSLALFSAALIAPAAAQSYHCADGQLLGGPAGYTCSTNVQGEIVSIQPATQTRAHTRRVTPTQTQTRTYTRTHNAPASHNHSHQHADGTVHTHAHSHSAPSHSPQPVVTRTVRRSAQLPRNTLPQHSTLTAHRPLALECQQTYTRLADSQAGEERVEVCYRDLTPLNTASTHALFERLEIAAKRACRRNSFSVLDRIGRNRTCERDAVYNAVLDINSPQLDSYYAQRTGKTLPRIAVGPLQRY